jgi:protein gp37
MENTAIEWCDHTFNPWVGCKEVSPACKRCYARARMDTRLKRVRWGGPRVRTSEETWKMPLRWNRKARELGVKQTVFCLSLGDIWDKAVPPAWRAEAFDVMRECESLTFLLLSKRIGNAEKMARSRDATRLLARPALPANAWLGATIVNQKEWDRDAHKLHYAALALGAAGTFVSVEPILGPIEMRDKFIPDCVIVGGETGHGARAPQQSWVRRLRDQTEAAGKRFHFKHWGEWAPMPTGKMVKLGRSAAGRLLDGREHNDRPGVFASSEPI